jgi:hypothetical protein
MEEGFGLTTGDANGFETGGSTQANLEHAPPGFVQIPQLSLQQTSVLLHIFFPHFMPLASGALTGARTGGRAIGVAMGNRGLPVGRDVGVPVQTFWIHNTPLFAQIPQPGLQQYSSAPHIFFPHFKPTETGDFVTGFGTGARTGGWTIGVATGSRGLPVGRDVGVSSTQASWIHAPPFGVQMPQLSLQHTWSVLHVFFPHFGPPAIIGDLIGGLTGLVGVGGKRGLPVGRDVGV